ncbi:hypothetical protein ACGLFO_07290 [Corynebacterium hesseae]|uniref:hypothetical protein n=1 Tax=Corynebacterium hesseae TaxID=2913502 RepID=UPI00373E1D0A
MLAVPLVSRPEGNEHPTRAMAEGFAGGDGFVEKRAHLHRSGGVGHRDVEVAICIQVERAGDFRDAERTQGFGGEEPLQVSGVGAVYVVLTASLLQAVGIAHDQVVHRHNGVHLRHVVDECLLIRAGGPAQVFPEDGEVELDGVDQRG